MFQCENVHASWCSNTRKEWGIQVSSLPIKDKVHSYQYFPVCHCQDNQLASVYMLVTNKFKVQLPKYWLLHISRNKINNLLIRPWRKAWYPKANLPVHSFFHGQLKTQRENSKFRNLDGCFLVFQGLGFHVMKYFWDECLSWCYSVTKGCLVICQVYC